MFPLPAGYARDTSFPKEEATGEQYLTPPKEEDNASEKESLYPEVARSQEDRKEGGAEDLCPANALSDELPMGVTREHNPIFSPHTETDVRIMICTWQQLAWRSFVCIC